MKLQVRILTAMLPAVVLLADAADGQVIQLPSYSRTGYSGTVSIPDSGTGYLGGSRYSQADADQRSVDHRVSAEVVRPSAPRSKSST